MKQHIITFEEYLNESVLLEGYNFDAKDEMRIQDIIKKANGNSGKERQLAMNMVATIKDKQKMQRRYYAALEVAGPYSIITQEFANGMIAFGINPDPTKSTAAKDAVNPELAELRKEAEDAFKNYRKPQYLYEPGEKYTSYYQQGKERTSYRGGEIVFNDPWAMYFWNNNMIGQMSDGMWENSRKYQDEWKFWVSLVPVFKPNVTYKKADEYLYRDIPNAKSVAQYAIQGNKEMAVFAKVATMNNSELLPILRDAWKIREDDLTIDGMKNIEEARKFADKYKIDFDLFLATLYCRPMKDAEAKRIISNAHSNIREAMANYHMGGAS